jgi:hypothetical protein
MVERWNDTGETKVLRVENCSYNEDEGNNNSNELDLKWKSTKFRGLSRGSSVGITTSYAIEGPGIVFRWGEIFRTRPGRLYTIGTGSFSVIKRPGRGVDYSPHLAPRLKKV